MGTTIELFVAWVNPPLWLVVLLAKVTLVLAAAGVAALVAARRWATVAHLLWTVSLAGILCLPLLQFVLPAWSLPWLQLARAVPPVDGAADTIPRRPAGMDAATSHGPGVFGSSGTSSTTLPAGAGLEEASLAGGAVERSGVHERLSQAGPLTAPARDSDRAFNSEADSPPWDARAWSWAVALLWVGGVLLVASRRGVEGWRLARMMRRAAPAPAHVRWRVDRLAREIGLSSSLVVRIEEARMPLAWWCGHWAILLPAEFESWPAAEQDTVLLHELTHIKRRDAWADMLAQIACCVYWFHPLVWWAAAEMRRLREQAADDLVLQSGLVLANQYARQLVDVVARCPGTVPAGVAMARPHELQRRVQRILGGTWQRRHISPAGSIAVLSIALVLVGLLASAQLRASPETPPEDSPAGALGDLSGEDDGSPANEAKTGAGETAETDGNMAHSRAAIASITAAGRVVDPNGNPVPGARVVLRCWSNSVSTAGLLHVDDILAEARTDAEGSFRFEDVPLSPAKRHILDAMRREGKGLDLVAQADGYGLAFMHLPTLASNEERVLSLSEEREVRGVVQDSEGRSVAGAEVVLVGISKMDTLFDPFLHNEHEIILKRSQMRLTARTDQDGRFRLGGLPRGSRAHLGIDHPRYLPQGAIVATDPDATSTTLQSNHSPTPDQPLFVSPATIELETGHPIRVQVMDEATGRPLPGGSFAVIHGGSERVVSVDESGVAELSLSRVGTQIALYRPPQGAAGLGVQRQIEVQDMSELQEFELRVPAVRTLQGRVVDDAGQEIAGATVRWFQQGSGEEVSVFSQAVSRNGGHFEIPVTSGEGRLTVSEAPPGFYMPSSRELRDLPEGETATLRPSVDVPASGEVRPVEITVPHGLVVQGHVTDASEEPVAGARIMAEAAGPTHASSATATTDEAGRYRLAGLDPRTPYTLRFVGPEGGAAKEVEGAVEHPLSRSRIVEMDVQLGPTAMLVGRVFSDGEPAAGVLVQLKGNQSIGDDRWRIVSLDRAETDAEGRYRLSGLLPGDRYQVEISSRMLAYDPTWTYGFPYFHEAPESIGGEIELPEMHLVPQTQTLAGVVVDPDGNPVAGATVSAQLKFGGSLARRGNSPAPWTETDEQGRFRLEQLPDVDLQLMAYIRPTGPDRRIRYPARIDVDRNQQDVRIVLDPSLEQDE